MCLRLYLKDLDGARVRVVFMRDVFKRQNTEDLEKEFENFTQELHEPKTGLS